MAAETLAAVALAGNILQFLQFSLEIVSTGRSLKRSHDGALKDHKGLDHVIKDLRSQLGTLDTNKSATLQPLILQCREICNELQDALSSVKRKGTGIWSTYRQALSIVWNKKKLEDVVKQLGLIREELLFHLQTIVRSVLVTIYQLQPTCHARLCVSLRGCWDPAPTCYISREE